MSATIDTPKPEATRGRTVLDLLPVLDGVEHKLRSGAMVAVTGDAEATIALAQAYPRSAFTGYEPDADLVASGRNVRFQAIEAAALPRYGFDLVASFAGLHDLATAQRIHDALADDGTVLVVEPGSHERAEAVLTQAGFSRVRLVADEVLEARP